MDPRRRPLLPGTPFAPLLLASLCLQGCLLSWGGKEGKVEPKPRADSSHYTFQHPTSSSRLHLDSTYTVRWQAGDSSGDGSVRMYLYREDALLGDFRSNLPSTGSAEWNLAATRFLGDYGMGSGSGYRFRIVNESDTSRSAFGPRFSIYSGYSGSLALTAPVPGSKVQDSILRIAWNVSGDVGDSVGLQLYLDSRLMTTLAIAVPAAAGGFSWPVVLSTMPTGSDYRVRIFALSDPGIAQVGPAFTFDTPVRTGAYEFIRPRAGDVWTAGEMVPLEWKVTGNPGEFTAITLWRDAPREFIKAWTPVGTSDSVRELPVPTDLGDGFYRLRAASLLDSTLHAFSPAFRIQGGVPPP